MNVDERLHSLAKQPYADKRKQPIWSQIYDRLRSALDSGLLPEGSRLPGEDDLAHMFGVTRVTLRRALSLLQREGRLVSRKGVGVFVRSISVRYEVRETEAFNTALSGEESTMEALSLVRKQASPGAAEALGLKSCAEVTEVRFIQYSQSTPYYLAIKEFPVSVMPGFALDYERTGSILDAYAAAGIHSYVRAETRITGDFATEEEADLLRISRQAPVLRSRSINQDSNGRGIEYNRGCWPMLSVELVFNNKTSGV